MNIPKDPVMLVSFLNLKLRDQYASLNALCDDLELNPEEITQKTASIDYHYKPEYNQFL